MKLGKWLFIISICLLTGYQGHKETPAQVVAVSIQEDSLRPMYHIDEFDCQSILIELFKSNGDTEIVPLETSMIEDADQSKLLEAGSHVLSVDVSGAETVLPINLYQTAYDYQLLSLYINGIHQSHIGDLSYSEWLLSIAGEPGISIKSSHINDAGHLILTFTDGSVHDAGYIMGEDGINGLDGLDGSNIELTVQDNSIHWRQEGLEWTPLIALSELRGSRGFTGAKGSDGVGITHTEVSEDGMLIIHYSDDTVEEVGPLYETYMVLYKDVHGSIIDLKSVQKGETITPPVAPLLEGHRFIRWSEEIAEVTDHAVIAPIYERLSMHVSFDSTGGLPVSSIDTPYATRIHLETPVKEGYQFDGWYLSLSEHAARFTEETVVTEDITLYAKWSRPVFTVVFNDCDGDVLKTGYTYPDGFVVPPSVPHVTGHTFMEWSHTSQGITSDLIIEPVYEPNTYTLNYHLLKDYEIGDTLALNDHETISSVAVGGAHSGLITNQGRLFMWGDNRQYQLGLPEGGLIDAPTLINPELNLADGETIVSMALGNAHTVLRTSHGNVITFGANADGQLGIGTTNPALTAHTLDLDFLSPDDTVIQIKAGGDHSGILTANGFVYLFGSNALNQIHPSETPYYESPERMALQFEVARGDTIKHLELGGSHNAVFTENNDVIMWGNSQENQIGFHDTYDFYRPYIILNTDEAYESIHLGANHTALLTNQRVLVWGGNESGQLGIGTTQNQYRPKVIDMDVSAIESVRLGSSVSLITTQDGRLWASGSISDGRIMTNTSADLISFTDVTPFYQAQGWQSDSLFAIGKSANNAHGIMVSNGNVIGWGSNEHHQLADSDNSLDIHDTGTYQIIMVHSEDVIYRSSDDLWVYYDDSENSMNDWYMDIALTELFLKAEMPAEDISLYGTIE